MAAEFHGDAVPRIGLLWRGDPAADPYSTPGAERLGPLMAALRRLNVTAVPVIYHDDALDRVRGGLLGLDGVLVWVNPIQDGANRSQLDALLRQAAAKGVWVSADPEVILTLGTKEVLYRTRDVGWGTGTDLYRDAADFRERFPRALARDKVRVLKQARGNGGNGVWRSSSPTRPPARAGQAPVPWSGCGTRRSRRRHRPRNSALGTSSTVAGSTSPGRDAWSTSPSRSGSPTG